MYEHCVNFFASAHLGLLRSATPPKGRGLGICGVMLYDIAYSTLTGFRVWPVSSMRAVAEVSSVTRGRNLS